MIISSRSGPGKPAKMGILGWVTCWLAGNEGLSMVAGKYSWVLAQGGSPIVKTLTGGKLGCYIHGKETSSLCSVLDI